MVGCKRKKTGTPEDEVQLKPGPENTITVRSVVRDEAAGQAADRVPESLGNNRWQVTTWNNWVKTSQYTWWNLVPLNLLQQAMVPANFYFIIMSIMQLIPLISDSNGVPTYLVPLAFVMAVTMIKDAWEDIKRHRTDREQNNRRTWVLMHNGRWEEAKWSDVKVGDIVKVEADNVFCADLIMLTCSDDFGIAYVNTVQLDGETNMKTKTAIPTLHEAFGKHIDDLANTRFQLTYGPPTSKLYNFNGVMKVESATFDFSNENRRLKASLSKRRSLFGSQSSSLPASAPSIGGGALENAPSRAGSISVPVIDQAPSVASLVLKAPSDAHLQLPNGEEFAISLNQFLWRGATLVNTAWVAGIVVYTGHNTRIYKNTRERAPKTSGLLKSYNVDAVVLFVAEVVLCLIAAGMYTFDISRRQSKMWYLAPHSVTELSGSVEGNFAAFGVAFGRYALLLSYFIPITLFVQVEICRWFESFFINADEHAYSTVMNCRASVSTMGVLEDLGNITHLFSDKTGTLTQNLMQLRGCRIGTQLFDEDDEEGGEKEDASPSGRVEQCERLYNRRLEDIANQQAGKEGVEIPDVLMTPNPFVSFNASKIRTQILSEPSNVPNARMFLLILSLCHSVLLKPSEVTAAPPEVSASKGGSRPPQSPATKEPSTVSVDPQDQYLGTGFRTHEDSPMLGNDSDRSFKSTRSQMLSARRSGVPLDHHDSPNDMVPTPLDPRDSDYKAHSPIKIKFDSQEDHAQELDFSPAPAEEQDLVSDQTSFSAEDDRDELGQFIQSMAAVPEPASGRRTVQELPPGRVEPQQLRSLLARPEVSSRTDSMESGPYEESRAGSPPVVAALPDDARSDASLNVLSPYTPEEASHVQKRRWPLANKPVALRLRDMKSVATPPMFVSHPSHRAAPGDPDTSVEMTLMRWPMNLATPYDASSPDELALVSGAKHLGVEFVRRPDLNSIQIGLLNENTERIVLNDEDRQWAEMHRAGQADLLVGMTYKVHEVLDFDNFRKRMSVIVTDRDGVIKLLCKGADSSMLKAAGPNQDKMLSDLSDSLGTFARDGLRTLVFGYREIGEAELRTFQAKLSELRGSGSDDVEQYASLYETVEKNLTLVGCTAIDDKLQDEVPETIAALKDAGIRVWVLTGDKVETAISIGFSCNLLTHDTYNAIIDGDTPEKVQQQMYEYMAFVVAGQLAKESFDRILQQVDTESPADDDDEDGVYIPGTERACSKCIPVRCCRGKRNKQERRRKDKDKTPQKNPTMGVEDFIRVVSLNARHTKVVAPVDGKSAPKALSPEEVERLIQLYIGAFEPHEERGPLGKLGEMISVKKSGATATASPVPDSVAPAATQAPARIPEETDVERFTAVAITVTGDALAIALASDEIKKYFFGLAHLCSTVIACRVTPKQKAEVVRECSRMTPTDNFTSLSVGDGANDVGMILTADVGVGIYGKEGSQAAASGDLTIGEFKMLRNLLFVHGHQILRRHSTMVYQTIYKNVLFAICCFICGYMCGFSAADPYDSYMKQLFNLLYTPWCIMSAAVFDRHLPYDILLRCGSLYSGGGGSVSMSGKPVSPAYYGFRRFCEWFFYAIVSGAVITVVPFFALQWGASLSFDGREGLDWHTYGQLIFNVIVILTVMSTVPYTTTVFWFTILAWILSIGSIYLSWFVISVIRLRHGNVYTPFNVLYNSFVSSLRMPSFHVISLLALLIPISGLYLRWKYSVMFHPQPHTIVRERLKKGVFDAVVAPTRQGHQTVVVPRTHQQNQSWKGFAYATSDASRFSLQRRSLSFRPGSTAVPEREGSKLPRVLEEDYGGLYDMVHEP